MANDNKQTPPSQSKNPDLETDRRAVGRHWPQSSLAFCGCGFTSEGETFQTDNKCPLGMPWACLRQLQLPFDEGPSEQRGSRNPRHCNTGVTTTQRPTSSSSLNLPQVADGWAL